MAALIKCDERPFKGEGLGGLCPPQLNSGGLEGSAPQPKPKNIRKKITVSVLVVFSNEPSGKIKEPGVDQRKGNITRDHPIKAAKIAILWHKHVQFL